MANHRKLPGLNYFELYEEKSQLYCSADHPLFLTEDSSLSESQISKYDAVIAAYPQTAEVKQLQTKLKASATSTGREGVAFLILSARYIGLLPTHVARQWVDRKMLRAVLPENYYYWTRFSVVTRKGARQNQILDAYLVVPEESPS